MIGQHTVKSQRPRSVHDTKALQEQAESAKFMAQTGNIIVIFVPYFCKLNLISSCMLSLVLHLLSGNVLHYIIFPFHSLLQHMNSEHKFPVFRKYLL